MHIEYSNFNHAKSRKSSKNWDNESAGCYLLFYIAVNITYVSWCYLISLYCNQLNKVNFFLIEQKTEKCAGNSELSTGLWEANRFITSILWFNNSVFIVYCTFIVTVFGRFSWFCVLVVFGLVWPCICYYLKDCDLNHIMQSKSTFFNTKSCI